MPSAATSATSSSAALAPRSIFSSPGIPWRTSSEKLAPHGKVDQVGRSFGIIKFTIRGVTYDVALPRLDAPKEAVARGHKDFVISADPWLPVEKDLERRDFRANSMAFRLKGGSLIDPFEGRKDTGCPDDPADQSRRLPR